MQVWPADQVERRARTHSEEQVAQIAGSVREWGWTIPVLVDEAGGIIAGHGRVLAALKLGLTEVPVMTARGWSEAQKRAYVIADNKLAMNADWDLDKLRVEMADLASEGFELDLIGFDDAELTDLLADRTEGLTDPDDAPDLQAVEIARPGEVWVLGRHRLACGDCTDAATVALALGGVTPHLMVTDPPYGVEYDADWRNQTGTDVHGKYQRVSSGKVVRKVGSSAIGKVMNDDRADWRDAWALFPGDVAYTWAAGLTSDAAILALEAAGFERRAHIIWNKSNAVISRGHYHFKHEVLWYAVRKGATGHWQGSKVQTSVWDIAKPRLNETGHSTQKPVECMQRPMENNSSPGQAVYDPFSGSGTSLIAAEQTGRACHAIELNPAYVDVAIRRWQNFTGLAATLDGDGRTFAEIEQERADAQGPTAEAHEAA